MTRPVVDNSTRAPLPKLGNLRTYWVVALTTVIILWPFSDLTIWHLIFFVALSAGIYLSYSRYLLPLIIYFSMMLLYWVVAPFLQGRMGVGYYTWRGDVPDFGPEALAFVMVHLSGIFIGFQFKKISAPREISPRARLSVIGIIFVLAFLLGLIAFIGFGTIILPRVEQATGEAQNYAIFLRNISKVLPALLFAYFVLESDRGLKGNTRLAIFGLLVFCVIIVSNPANTGRFLSLFGLFIVILAYTIKFSKLKVLAWALAIAPVYGIFLLGATSAMRAGFGSVDLKKAFQSLQSLEFSTFSIFLDALRLDDFAYGNYLASHLLILIPRSLWTNKAESIGIYVAENSGYVYHNVGLTSFFNAYADFGYAGLLCVSVVFGMLVKNLNPTFEVPTFRNRRFMYGVIFTGMTPMFFRGDLSTAMLAFYAAAIGYETVRFFTRFRIGVGN